MKTLSPRIIQSAGGTLMMVLVSAAMICSINVTPSFGDDDHDREGRHDNGRYEQRGYDHDREGRHDNGRYEQRGRRHDRDRYEHDRRWRRDRSYYYGYREPVYVPPPVFFEPPRPPGIDIFFPRIIIRP